MGAEGTVAPESTLSAFRAAIAYGLDYVEVDPRPTSDGVLVVMHDGTVDRTTSGHGRVELMTLAYPPVRNRYAGSKKYQYSETRPVTPEKWVDRRNC